MHIEDGQPRLILLSNDSLGSYAVIADLFVQTFERAGVRVERRSDNAVERERLAGAGDGPRVVQNTIGPLFEAIPGARNVALVHHEWDRYPREWTERLNGFDEVWATTPFVVSTLRHSGVRATIRLQRPALDLERIPARKDYRDRCPVRFLACGEAHFRKGFHLLMQGFLLAFPEPGEACLLIHTSPGCDWVAPRSDIRIDARRMGRAQMLAEYRRHDIYVSASLGEGLGLPVAEAILAGIPVATNNWGGHRSLLTTGCYFRIPHVVMPQCFCSRPDYYAVGQRCAMSAPPQIARTLRAAARTPAAARRLMAGGARVGLLERFGSDAVLGGLAAASALGGRR